MFEYTVENFKKLFCRGEFSFLPIYDDNKSYLKGDEVYQEDVEQFYTSEIDYNKGNKPSENLTIWTITVSRVEDYILDSDIERAFAEAKANFNEKMFETPELMEIAFYYLSAHYLCIDQRNADGSYGAGYTGMAQSKTVGNVSASYVVPQRYLNNPYYAFLAQTGFGNKYLSYIIPRSVARCMWVAGRSLP